jgi:hypothetical protein
MLRKKLSNAAALILGFAVGLGLMEAPIAFAGTTGKISGRIIDVQNRSPLSGANVIIEGTTLGAAADAEGYYTILLIPPGTYNVVARILGYKDVKITGVVVRADLTSKVDFRLESTVIAVGEAVTVVAERPLVLPDLTSSSRRVDAKEIEDIPGVNTVTEAVQLMPGVVGEGENIHVRGGRSGEVMFWWMASRSMTRFSTARSFPSTNTPWKKWSCSPAVTMPNMATPNPASSTSSPAPADRTTPGAWPITTIMCLVAAANLRIF